LQTKQDIPFEKVASQANSNHLVSLKPL